MASSISLKTRPLTALHSPVSTKYHGLKSSVSIMRTDAPSFRRLRITCSAVKSPLDEIKDLKKDKESILDAAKDKDLECNKVECPIEDEPKKETAITNSQSTPRDFSHLWDVCDNCDQLLYKRILKSNMNICEHCGHHLKVDSSTRIEFMIDSDTWDPRDEEMVSTDPIDFDGEVWKAPVAESV